MIVPIADCQASLQGGRHFLVTYATYITQINLEYHLRCFELEIEPYKWLVQFYKGLDGDALTGRWPCQKQQKQTSAARGDTATQTVSDALMLRSGASWGKPVCGGGGGGGD